MQDIDNNGKIVAGIDVGKADLALSAAAGAVQHYANTPEGIAALALELARQSVDLAVYEPTGGYERPLAEALSAAGLPARPAHPNRVRAYARARGQQAKTDPLDAQILAQYGADIVRPQMAEQVDPASDAHAPQRAELRDLLRRREQLVKQRTQEKLRQDKGASADAQASVLRNIAWLDEEIARLEEAYQALLRSVPALSEAAERYRSVPGVGLLTAATLVAELPELGRCASKDLVALVGLAPWARDSGRQRGRRRVQGGRGRIRRVLYLAAQSAARHHAQLREFYQGLRSRGKPGKVALTAVMRKLVMQLNAIAFRATPWTPQPARAG